MVAHSNELCTTIRSTRQETRQEILELDRWRLRKWGGSIEHDSVRSEKLFIIPSLKFLVAHSESTAANLKRLSFCRANLGKLQS